MQANGQRQKIDVLFQDQREYFDKTIVTELTGIKEEFEAFNQNQKVYQDSMQNVHEDIKKALTKNNIGNRLLARVILSQSDKIYRIIILLICGLIGVKAVEFLQAMPK
jgi:3-oxoacyl-[acyl-carrier-protein] synthase III